MFKLIVDTNCYLPVMYVGKYSKNYYCSFFTINYVLPYVLVKY